MEMRTRVLKTGGKASLDLKWQRMGSRVSWKVELVNDEAGHLAEEIILSKEYKEQLGSS